MVDALLACADRRPVLMLVCLVVAVLLVIIGGAVTADTLVGWAERDDEPRRSR